jgi:hypothetical protein
LERALGFAALAGFLVSLCVHVAALFGVVALIQMQWIWWLHVGIFVVFFPFVMNYRKAFPKKPGLAELRASFPDWVVALGLCAFVYALVNFALFLGKTGGGNPMLRDGQYLLMSHGRLIRELSSSEYNALKVNEVRGFSGHWLLFYFMPMAYFLLRRSTGDRTRPAN